MIKNPHYCNQKISSLVEFGFVIFEKKKVKKKKENFYRQMTAFDWKNLF